MTRRTLLKAISFETISTITGCGLAWLMFGDFGSCVLYSVIAYAMKLTLFCWHERLWR
jgi:uncharacterized membrane protein